MKNLLGLVLIASIGVLIGTVFLKLANRPVQQNQDKISTKIEEVTSDVKETNILTTEYDEGTNTKIRTFSEPSLKENENNDLENRTYLEKIGNNSELSVKTMNEDLLYANSEIDSIFVTKESTEKLNHMLSSEEVVNIMKQYEEVISSF